MKFENIASNLNSTTVGGVIFYISYETTIAVEDTNTGDLFISENMWSRTTGKHLNLIDDDKSIRLPYGEFEDILRDYERKLGV